MSKLPVTKLVSKHCSNLVWGVAFNQSVVENNVLLPGQTKEVGIGMAATLATVDDEELVQRELEVGSKGVDLCLELAFGERRQLIEERQDEDWVSSGHEDLQASSKGPEVDEKLASGPLDNAEESGEDRGQDDGGDEVGLDEIGKIELGALLVESMLLFEDKGIVEARRKVEDLLEGEEREDEEDRVADLAGKPSRGKLEEQVARERPDLGHDVEIEHGSVLDLIPETVNDGEECLGATVFLRLCECLWGDLLGEDGGGLRAAQDAILAEGKERLEEIVAGGEAHEEFLPWEERAVEEPRQLLRRELAERRDVARDREFGRATGGLH